MPPFTCTSGGPHLFQKVGDRCSLQKLYCRVTAALSCSSASLPKAGRRCQARVVQAGTHCACVTELQGGAVGVQCSVGGSHQGPTGMSMEGKSAHVPRQ